MTNYNAAGLVDIIEEDMNMETITERDMKKLEALIKEIQSDVRSAVETAYFNGFSAGKKCNNDDKWDYRPKTTKTNYVDPEYYEYLYNAFKD